MSACPSDEAWAAFPKAVGAVEHQALVQHLAACSPCRTIVAELARQGAIAFSDTVDPSLPAGRDPVTTNRLGRFIVLDVLGEGGMGTVLSAYDPRLDRRVALKVLRGATARSPAGHARLLREAQALARIAHPHVVPIHEVAELDGEVVLVMEHVPGQTLQEWVRAGSPPWREIVRAYIQAGRGLAAVHAAGFVHRDFKPSNALIGADARVRVIDFGLVREELTTTAGDEPPPIGGTPAIDGADGSDRLTRTGTVLGTPAYMAPEQFERADVGPRTDVYGFCISLTEALYGIRPFTGRRPGFAEGEGDDPPTATSVPRAVWIALRKGLSARPEDRPATIDTVLDELSALVEPSRRRWIVAAVVSTSLAGVAIGWFALPSAVPQEEPCSGGAAQLAPIWSDSIAGAVTSQLIASGSAYGEQVAPRVVATLTSYANAWTAAHRAACMSHRRGEQSAALLDRQMYCLDRHRQALSSTVDLLVHADAPGDPVRLVLGLPSLQRCTNRDELAATSPADGSQHGQSHALEGALERAAALERNGDYAGASEVAARIVRDAEPLAIEQLDAAANLQLGRARLLAGDLAQAEQPLRAALRHAIAADAPAIAVEAIARRIYAAGMTGGLDQTRLAELRALAEDFLQRTHDGGFAHALLLNNVGVIHRSLGQREAARDVLRQALDARGAVARPEMEMSVIVENLA
ncbi:MAG: protein kinase, partial [Kofleriaceae bacterium]